MKFTCTYLGLKIMYIQSIEEQSAKTLSKSPKNSKVISENVQIARDNLGTSNSITNTWTAIASI